MSLERDAWRQLIRDTRLVAGVEGAVPRDELIETMSGQGWTETEARELIRESQHLEATNSDPMNPQIDIADNTLSETEDGDEDGDGDVGDGADDRDAKQILADRLSETDLDDARFIDVVDGEKKSVDHTTRAPQNVSGNYGVYADGDGLVLVDVDEGENLDVELPETFQVQSPHVARENEGHFYYDLSQVDDIGAKLESVFGVKNPNPSYGEIRVVNQYVVGAGSQLDGCGKEWCDECATDGGGRYEIEHDAPIRQLGFDTLIEIIEDGMSDAEGGGESGENTENQTLENGNFGGDKDAEEDRLSYALKNDDTLRDLWNGRYAAAGYGDDRSRAECALASRLAFWFEGDKRRVSSLMDDAKTQKWDERGRDYHDSVLEAVDEKDEYYSPSRNQTPAPYEGGGVDSGDEDVGDVDADGDGDEADRKLTYDLVGDSRLELHPHGEEIEIRIYNGDGRLAFVEKRERGFWTSSHKRSRTAGNAENAVDEHGIREATKSVLDDIAIEATENPDEWRKKMRAPTVDKLLERTNDVVAWRLPEDVEWHIELDAHPERPDIGAQTVKLGGDEIKSNDPAAFESQHFTQFLIETEISSNAWEDLSSRWIEDADVRQRETDIELQTAIESLMSRIDSGAFDVWHEDEGREAFSWDKDNGLWMREPHGEIEVRGTFDDGVVAIPSAFVSRLLDDTDGDIRLEDLSQELRDREIMLSPTRRKGINSRRGSIWQFDATHLDYDEDRAKTVDDDVDEPEGVSI